MQSQCTLFRQTNAHKMPFRKVLESSLSWMLGSVQMYVCVCILLVFGLPKAITKLCKIWVIRYSLVVSNFFSVEQCRMAASENSFQKSFRASHRMRRTYRPTQKKRHKHTLIRFTLYFSF